LGTQRNRQCDNSGQQHRCGLYTTAQVPKPHE
jgi:hypothetical protein